jgi:hypothetical protein
MPTYTQNSMPISSENCFLLLNGTRDKVFDVSILYNFYLHCLSPNGPRSKNNNVQLRDVIPSELKTARTKENKKQVKRHTRKFRPFYMECKWMRIYNRSIQIYRTTITSVVRRCIQSKCHCVYASMPYQRLCNHLCA